MTYGNRTTRTFDDVEYAPGRQFRVLRPAKLTGWASTGWASTGSSAWNGWAGTLQPGDIITCVGYGPGFGSDPGYGIEFTSPQTETAGIGRCEFTPSHGGPFGYRPQPGYLEPADKETPPVNARAQRKDTQ